MKCSFCSETFTRHSVLVRHIRIAHDPQYESKESKVSNCLNFDVNVILPVHVKFWQLIDFCEYLISTGLSDLPEKAPPELHD